MGLGVWGGGGGGVGGGGGGESSWNLGEIEEGKNGKAMHV